MEKIPIIKTMISWADLSPEEGLALVKDLIAKWALKREDCFAVDLPTASSDVPSCSVSKRRGRPKKVQPAAEADKNVSDESADAVSEPAVSELQKTEVSTEEETKPADVQPAPKRRGRPKKVKPAAEADKNVSDENVDAVSEPAVSEFKKTEVSAEEEKKPADEVHELTAADKALIEEVEQTAASSKDEAEDAISEAMSRSGFLSVSECPALKEKVFGKQYSYAFLYNWKGRNVLSRQVLSDLMPVGIYVPYKRVMFGKYKGFVVSLYDENVHTSIDGALYEAEKSFAPIGGENWSVMNSMQWVILREILGEVNQMLRKVGGDLLRAPYKTPSPRSNQVCGIGKFRYAIDVA